MGYEILLQFPANDDEGYVFMGIYGEARNLFLEGPSGVTFELFEIKN